MDIETAFQTEGNKILDTQVNVRLSTNGNTLTYFNFDRYIPNEFRFYLTENYCSYHEMLTANDANGLLLRQLLETGFIYSFNWEVIFEKILIKNSDTPEVIYRKDFLRNSFLKFSLLCEKANFFNGVGKNTCGNFVVPWEDYYNIYTLPQPVLPIPPPPQFVIENANTRPIAFPQMNSIYQNGSSATNLSNAAYEVYTPKSIIPINYLASLAKPKNPCDIPGNYFTFITFPSYVNTFLAILDVIYGVSDSILNGKNPGVPGLFKDYFNYEIAQYYYSQYNPVILTRNKILSFSI